ncbi:MAG: dephospho-CoA kinase, partial [Clostridia bacterium]|nr:dephospho-CoA kinase [Clostridia bacterium]
GRLIDCDKLYAEMLKTDCEMTRDLAKNFPECYIDGKIVKSELSKAVFNNREKLEKLNKLTHSHIVKEIMRIIDENPSVDFWLDAPTLFESGLHLYCTKLVAVVADEDTCIARIMKRDGITEEQAKKRLANQMPADFFKKYCDQVIYN